MSRSEMTLLQQTSIMSQLKDGLSCRSGLSLLLYLTVSLLLLTHCSDGWPQVICPPQPVFTLVGEDIILPCHLKPVVEAFSETTEWTRPDLEPPFVHVRRGGKDLRDMQSPAYEGRTCLSVDGLKLGDLSLRLSRVRPSDAGEYRCFVPEYKTDAFVQLVVGVVSPSATVAIGRDGSGVILQCESAGWFPEPEVLWLDGEGKLVSAGPPETSQSPDGLYTVSSRVTVEKHSSSFTCRVQQKDVNQTREAHIYVPADLFMVQSNLAARIVVCLTVSVTAVVVVVVFVWKKGQNQKGTTNSSEMWPLMDGDDPMTSSDKMKYFERKTAKLVEDLKKNTSEKQHVEHVIAELQKQKEDLKKQRNTLTSLLSEDKIQLQEIEKKLKEGAKVKADHRKEKRENALEALMKRKAKHDEMLQVTEEQLKITEDLINKMMEIKGKLERDKEQIDKNLKDVERLKEKTEETVQSEEEEQTGTKDQPRADAPSSVQTM